MNDIEKIIEDVLREATANVMKSTNGTSKGAFHPGAESSFTIDNLNAAMEKLPTRAMPVAFCCHSSYLQKVRNSSVPHDTAGMPGDAGGSMLAAYGIDFFIDDDQEHACLAFYDRHSLLLWLKRRKLWNALLLSVWDGQRSYIPCPPISLKEAREIANQWPWDAQWVMEIINQKPKAP